ncbi:hypothetical protein Q1695_011665 [Nippostrongylus brasiliensis]|nr:hypothetical protein Q1695_011665 [Nippostrongylus brasiliensis]
MLSPALLKDSLNRRPSNVQTLNPDDLQAIYGSQRRRSGEFSRRRSGEIDDELQHARSNSAVRRPSLLLITDLDLPRRTSSAGLKKYKRKISAESGVFRKLTAEPTLKSAVDLRLSSLSLQNDVHLDIAICPHQYTADPTLAWEMLKEKRPVKPVRQMKLDTPIKPDHVRFVCIGCTHGVKLDPSILPLGDVLLVAGDFTTCGLPNEVHSFNKKLGQLKHAYKVVIAGNHECTFDDSFLRASNREVEAKEMALKQALQASLASAKVTSSKSLLTNAIYLEDSVIELFGITIYGTPWQPRVDNWAFNLPRGQALLDKWNNIPSGVDVLLTHSPPLGHGDQMADGQRMGCVELLNSVSKRIKPKYHVFSHIHEGYGCTSDGYTKFINCCICDENLQPNNSPIIFDIPVHPHTKQFYLQNIKKVMKRYHRSGKK